MHFIKVNKYWHVNFLYLRTTIFLKIEHLYNTCWYWSVFDRTSTVNIYSCACRKTRDTIYNLLKSKMIICKEKKAILIFFSKIVPKYKLKETLCLRFCIKNLASIEINIYPSFFFTIFYISLFNLRLLIHRKYGEI